MELDVRECLRIIYDAYVSSLYIVEDNGGSLPPQLLPLLDSMMRMERIICTFLGISGKEMIQALKDSDLIVENAIELCMQRMVDKYEKVE